MANPRALASALFCISLAAVSAMFACNGATSDPYQAMTGAASATPPPPDAMSASMDASATPPRDVVGSFDWDATSYPLSRCAVSSDVFYLDVSGPSGPLQSGEITKTDAGTYWFVALAPELNVMLASPTGPVGSIQVWTPDSSPVTPGTYPQSPSGKGTQIDVVVINQPCTISSGTLTVLDLDYDWPDGSTMGDVNSLLLSFDLMCDPQVSLRGCVRYAK